MSRRAVFIDRDGVILHSPVEGGTPRPPRSHHEFAYLPGVAEALALIRNAGLLPVVVTNQPDVARGATSRALVEAFHDRLRADHGLVHDLTRSFLVGDRWRDVEAGRRAGCATLLVRHDYSGDANPDVSVSSLLEAAQHITRSHDMERAPWTSQRATSTT
jgi:D-glycero-D-manno-heptose 1,7-bisphosphate phosphatase